VRATVGCSIGGASRRELLKLGMNVGGRSLGSLWRCTAVPRLYCARLLLHRLCPVGYLRIVNMLTLRPFLTDTHRVSRIICQPQRFQSKSCSWAFFLRVSISTRPILLSTFANITPAVKPRKHSIVIYRLFSYDFIIILDSSYVFAHVSFFRRTAFVAGRSVRPSDGYLYVYAL
jgi:hypothetical protein